MVQACSLVSYIWTMCCGCDILIALLFCSGELAAKSFLVPKAFALIAYYWNDQYLINELLIVLLHTGMLMIIHCESFIAIRWMRGWKGGRSRSILGRWCVIGNQ